MAILVSVCKAIPDGDTVCKTVKHASYKNYLVVRREYASQNT